MTKRIKWLDFARGIAILTVVIGHSIGSIYSTKAMDSVAFNLLMSILFTFMMPCFFAISGYLYKPIRNIHSYLLMLYKKGISLGIPYIIFSIIYVIMQNMGGGSVNKPHSYGSILLIYKSPISYLWFLYALFIVFLIVGALDLLKVNKYLQIIIYIIMLLVSIIFPHVLWPGITWAFNDIIYFYVGYLFSTESVSDEYIRIFKSKSMFIILLIIFILLLYIQSYYVVGGPTDISTFSDFPTKIISIFILIQMSTTILSTSRVFRYFDKYGKMTLVIYLAHAPFISILRAISFKIFPINSVSILFILLLIIICSWCFSIFICFLAKRITLLNFVFYPRKRYISKLIIRTNFGRWLLNK